ncbi:hypothetical protein [Variovorax sp. dw_308]|uniref:hypothetical protein n=1 Tax=Variovorax sp. dw_308 TaxID=2721546 RepID=UPI001C493EFD|nr:hypothetical protein [Variovorax sp. dw_308]
MTNSMATQPGDKQLRRKGTATAVHAQEMSDLKAAVARMSAVLEACDVIVRALAPENAPGFIRAQELLTQILTAANKLERESVQEIVDGIKAQHREVLRTKLELRAIKAVMTGTEWRTAAELGRLFNPNVVNARSGVNRWRANGRIFGIDHQGRELYPAYVFDATWRPLPAIRKVLDVLTGLPPILIAGWFESTSSALGGKRPRELIASDPDAVLAAAEDRVTRENYG